MLNLLVGYDRGHDNLLRGDNKCSTLCTLELERYHADDSVVYRRFECFAVIFCAVHQKISMLWCVVV